MTRRERLERKAERRREWAAGRDARARGSFAAVDRLASSIPLGQPILVGHHSERRARRDQERIRAGMEAGLESARMADHHRQKADGLERQLERAIFTDDPDARERLLERIAELEAERERRKRANRAWKVAGDPPYSLTNLGANIRRLKARLLEVERAAREDEHMRQNPNSFRYYYGMMARRSGEGCGESRHPIAVGDLIGWNRRLKRAVCADCWARWEAENREADRLESGGAY